MNCYSALHSYPAHKGQEDPLRFRKGLTKAGTRGRWVGTRRLPISGDNWSFAGSFRPVVCHLATSSILSFLHSYFYPFFPGGEESGREVGFRFNSRKLKAG